MEISSAEIQKKKIFVATPAYGGMVTTGYTKSTIELQALCCKNNIDVTFFLLSNESLVQRARNYCADEFLRSNYTHLFFWDADITTSAMDILHMAALDKDIIGAPYPKKTIAWEKVIQALDHPEVGKIIREDPTRLEEFTGDYVFNLLEGTKSMVIREPVQVMEIGTGAMMIKRETFKMFRDKYPEQAYKPDHNRSKNFDGSRKIFAYFDCIIDPESERYLSEDYFFCQQSRKAGAEIWMCPWMKNIHSGTFNFLGSLESLARINAPPGAPNK